MNNNSKTFQNWLKQPKEDKISLHICAKTNNVRLKRRLLDFKENINEEDWEANTPLIVVLTYNSNKVAQIFIEEGADIEKPTRISKSSPLHLSIFYNNEELFYILLNAGASIKTKDKQGQTPLHVATTLYRKNFAEELIGIGAKVSTKDNEEQNTALHVASKLGHGELIEILIQAGARVNEKNKFHQTPLHLAKNSIVINKLLEGGVDINIEDTNQRTLTKMLANNERIKDSYSKVLLVQHIEKLNLINYYVGKTYVLAATNLTGLFSIKLDNFRAECLEEIEKLKIGYFGIYSLFKILKATLLKLAAIANSDKFEDWYKNKVQQEKFPNYADTIDAQFIRGLTRKAIEDSVNEKINKLWEIDLPKPCIEGIIALLNNENLKNIKRTPLKKNQS